MTQRGGLSVPSSITGVNLYFFPLSLKFSPSYRNFLVVLSFIKYYLAGYKEDSLRFKE